MKTSHVQKSSQQQYLYITSFHVLILLPPFMISQAYISFPLPEQSAATPANLSCKT